MPTYNYECSECQICSEAVQEITENPLVDCPNCQTPSLQRVISTGISSFRVENLAKNGERGCCRRQPNPKPRGSCGCNPQGCDS